MVQSPLKRLGICTNPRESCVSRNHLGPEEPHEAGVQVTCPAMFSRKDTATLFNPTMRNSPLFYNSLRLSIS